MESIAKWKEMSLRLKKLKQEESELRRELCDEILAGYEMSNGRLTVKDHLEGFEVKATQTLSYTIDVAILSTVYDALNPSEQACIKWEPKLKLAEYKKLPEDSLLNEAVITRLAMPTLTADPEAV